MIHQTSSQKMSQVAYEGVEKHAKDLNFISFARSFPSLIHSCGLAQAVVFAQAKDQKDYLCELTKVLKAAGHEQLSDLGETARTAEVTKYIRLSRHALQAAGWIKRYVEAVQEKSQ